MYRAGRVNEAAAVGVRKSDLHLVPLDRAQRVEEIVDVEADLDFLALVRHLNLVLGFLLLRVVGLQGQEVGARSEPDAAVLLVRKDRRPLQGLTQALPVSPHGFGRVRGYDSRVLRETAIDQL